MDNKLFGMNKLDKLNKLDKSKELYADALRQVGQSVKGNEYPKTLRKKWQEYRKKYKKKYGVSAPSVYDSARAYRQSQSEEAPTIDFGMDYINNFIARLERIYQDTIAFIDANKEGTHESGKLASIADYRLYTGELQDSYYRVLSEIRTYLDSGVSAEILAQAIADNVELDYTIAIELIPPSDINYLFDETYEQLQGIWTQINARAQELAQEQENEYYGQ